MAKVSITIKTDEKVKEEAKKVFQNLGLDMTTAVNLFLMTTIRENELPFKINLNKQNEHQNFIEKVRASLMKAEQDIAEGNGIALIPALNELKEKYGLYEI